MTVFVNATDLIGLCVLLLFLVALGISYLVSR